LLKYDEFYPQWQCILVSRDELATQLYKELNEGRAKKYTQVLQDKIRRMISPQVLGVFLEYGTSVAIPSFWKVTYPVLWKILINRKGGNLDFFFKCIGAAIGGNDPTLKFSKNVTEWAKQTVDISMAMNIGGKKLFSLMLSDNDLDLVDLFKLIFRENKFPHLLKTLQDHIPKTTSKQANQGHQPNPGLNAPEEHQKSTSHSSSTPMEETMDQAPPLQSSQSSPISTTVEHHRVRSEARPTDASAFLDEEAVESDVGDNDGEEDEGLPSWNDVEDTFCEEAKLGQCKSLQLLKTRMPTFNAELYEFLEYLSEQYDLLVMERDGLKRDLERTRMGKRRIVEDSESEFPSESMRSKQKKLGKENIDSPLPSKKLFAQEEGTKRRSSDSNGGNGGPRKTETTRAITPYHGVPRRKRNEKNTSTPAALNRTENSRNNSGSSSEATTKVTRMRSPNPLSSQLARSNGDNNIATGVIKTTPSN
jgi:hypothetical protein